MKEKTVQQQIHELAIEQITREIEAMTARIGVVVKEVKMAEMENGNDFYAALRYLADICEITLRG